jgi:hypothetical protein
MPLFTWYSEPDLWSGFSGEDSAAYAVWVAMTAGTDQDEPEGDDPPA